MPVDVLMVATLAVPSDPGWTSMIRPSFHLEGGRLSSFTKTSVLISNGGKGIFHLVFCCNSKIYSLFQRTHRFYCSCWILCQLDNLASFDLDLDQLPTWMFFRWENEPGQGHLDLRIAGLRVENSIVPLLVLKMYKALQRLAMRFLPLFSDGIWSSLPRPSTICRNEANKKEWNAKRFSNLSSSHPDFCIFEQKIYRAQQVHYCLQQS